MIDFLRALAPPHLSTMPRANAVLTSRYASDAPLRAVRLAASTGPTEFDNAQVARPEAGRTALAAATIHKSPDRAAESVASETSWPSLPEPAREASLHGLDTKPLPLQKTRHQSTNTAQESAAPLPPEALAHPPGNANATSSWSNAALAKPSISTLASTQTVREGTAKTVSSIAFAAPLSQATVSSRLAEPASAAARPVIHVTIDRIDIRAPATAARPAATTKTRPANTAVSLSDYLRGSTVKRGNGGSP